MRDNVIPLPTRAERDSTKAKGQKDAEDKKIASEHMRAKAMRKRLDDHKMINKVSDRIRVAKNLWRILNEMEAQGHKSEKLLRDLHMGRPDDSTKQLYNYVLPEDATPEPDSKKVHALTKTASLYLRIAQGAAKAMKSDPELIVLRLFENTSYQVEGDVADEKIAVMEQMRQLLVGMADAAIKRNDLGTYLEMLETRRIGWNVDGSFGDYHSLPIGLHFGDRAARHVSYLGYAPTVLLYEQSLSVAPIDGEAFQIDFEDDPRAVENFLRKSKPLPKKHRVPVSLSAYREIWFGIGPMETGWIWKPIFEKRLSLHVRSYDSGSSIDLDSYDPMIAHASTWHDHNDMRFSWLHLFTLLPRSRGGARLSISISPHIMDNVESVGSDDVHREDLEDRWLIALNRFDGGSLAIDPDIDASKGQFFYELVDLASCAKYLDQVADPGDREFDSECSSVSLNHRLWRGYREREVWYEDDITLEGRPTMYVAPRGSIARAIEHNLVRYGVADRLDTLLFETVAERVKAAAECHQQALQNRESRFAELLNLWKDD